MGLVSALIWMWYYITLILKLNRVHFIGMDLASVQSSSCRVNIIGMWYHHITLLIKIHRVNLIGMGLVSHYLANSFSGVNLTGICIQ